MAELRLKTPLRGEDIEKLSLMDTVYVSGTLYTARDEAHERILNFLGEGKQLPFNLEGGVIFHCGPLMKRIGDRWTLISGGPTTSSRMNDLEPQVIEKCSVKAVIGKGGMSDGVAEAMKKNKTAYLAFTGGAAALAAEKVKAVEGVHWLDLGMPEAVWVLRVEDFGPLTVAMVRGQSLYSSVNKEVKANLSRLIQRL